MNWFDFFVIILFIFTFIGGLKEGVVKGFFSLLTTLIAIPTAGHFYYLAATILSFLPGKDWENFFGFFITMGIFSALLQLIFFMPRRIFQKVWGQGTLYHLFGGILNFISTGIGFALLVVMLRTYPIIEWAVRLVTDSRTLAWLTSIFSFVPSMLPEIFQRASTIL